MSTTMQDRIGTGLATMPRVNLLPPELTQRRRLRTVQYSSGGVALVAVAAMAAATVFAGAGISTAQGRVDSANARQASLQRQVASYGDVTNAYSKAALVDTLIKTATAGEVHWTRYLNLLATTTPNNISLTGMTVTPATSAGTATTTGATAGATASGTSTTGAGTTATSGAIASIDFAGTALSNPDIANWLEILAKQPGYVSVYLNKSTEQKTTPTTYVFDITLNVTTAALQSAVASGGN